MTLNARWLNKASIGYWAVLAVCFAVALWAGETLPAVQFDNYVYDLMLGLHPPDRSRSEAVILAIDDATLNTMGGQRRLRGIVADAIEAAIHAQPRVIASDVIVADKGDESEDARLEKALSLSKNVILPADIDPETKAWEEPLPRFAKLAAAVGHVESEQTPRDGVTREISLELVAGHRRHWALALEAFRLSQGGGRILESPDDVRVGMVTIPARRTDGSRALRIRYSSGGLPVVSVNDLIGDPRVGARLKDKVVFLGVTSLSATRDRVVTPFGGALSGVAIHAEAFETIGQGAFLRDASDLSVLSSCAAVALLAGLIFAFVSGMPAYLLGAVLLAVVNAAPFWCFSQGLVFPYVAPLSCAWITVAAAASYQHFVVRKRLNRAEAEKARYQQAIHFVTHEMRSPLTAIQGSSELIGRYNLTEDKRKQMAGTINSESKRLARMIQTFLDVERLSDGHMELKREPVGLRVAVEACMQRVRPLAERKNIAINGGCDFSGTIIGDGELIEYAIYNLLNNAVKYSPPDTVVTVTSTFQKRSIALSVADQGIGMDAKELKEIFRKFYRTKRAEQSGEAGTGIGLSIVEQIVAGHGGRMEVTSTLGKGSCFTVILPAAEAPALLQ
jgi:signal transduction histidine kinase